MHGGAAVLGAHRRAQALKRTSELCLPSLTYASVAHVSGSALRWRDVVALTKPRLSALVFLTTGVGLWCAPGDVNAWRGMVVLAASAAVVAAANTLNSYMERDTDALMRRTRSRPLPAGRIEPRHALWLGLALGTSATGVLYVAGGPVCALLSFVAFLSYVGVYTPMKRYSAAAVVVGAIPGAIPPMMGWAASAGRLHGGAWALFVLMCVWQMPHFFAISLYLAEDYARGGHRVLPLVIGERRTRRWMLLTAAALVPASLLPVWWGQASAYYGAVALATGGAFFGVVAAGAGRRVPPGWARQVFVGSVLHLSLLLLALFIDGSRSG